MPNNLTFIFDLLLVFILAENNQKMEGFFIFNSGIEWLIIYISFSDPDWYILDYINILTDYFSRFFSVLEFWV